MAIPNTVKLFGDLKSLAVDITGIVKSGVSFSSIAKVFALISDLSSVISDLPAAVPEMESMGEDDAASVTKLVYEIGEACLVELKS